MKRLVGILALFFGILAKCYSQSTPISVGLRGGVSFSNFAGENVNTDARTGINFGAFLTYSTDYNFGVTGEVNYAQKGAKTANSKLNVNYLEIPIHLTYFFGKGGFRPKIMAGPYVGFLMNSELEINNAKVNVKDLYKSEDFGLSVGGGFHLDIGDAKWFYLDGRYGIGLADVTKAGGNVYNRVFSINIGISFGLDQ
ncbi:MAG: porin family protein [Cytophagales bacterium]|nr:PorT family protein [Bernardetiaceae bacterium]MDW8210214.1 porin family protein [Cytophagales bacterium]